jgi:hypothetical protein
MTKESIIQASVDVLNPELYVGKHGITIYAQLNLFMIL